MEILVSINCITYNHEKYISQAIESFLMQKTNFEFEIVIGEDCSTDNTRKIVEEYVKRYPEKIVLVTSEKNVGMKENEKRIYQQSRGKYIAECEGDDYWIDPYKLQKQIDYMEKHPRCTLCFHNANKVKTDNTLIDILISKEIISGIYDAGQIAELGVIATSSKLYPKYVLENLPYWYEDCIFTDLPAQLIMTSLGYAYYINEIMSVYRVGVENSAMYYLAGNKYKPIEDRILLPQKSIEILNIFDRYTEYYYTQGIKKRVIYFEFMTLCIQGNIKKIKEQKYSNLYKNLDKKKKIGVYVQAYFPNMYILLARFDEVLSQIFRRYKWKNPKY